MATDSISYYTPDRLVQGETQKTYQVRPNVIAASFGFGGLDSEDGAERLSLKKIISDALDAQDWIDPNVSCQLAAERIQVALRESERPNILGNPNTSITFQLQIAIAAFIDSGLWTKIIEYPMRFMKTEMGHQIRVSKFELSALEDPQNDRAAIALDTREQKVKMELAAILFQGAGVPPGYPDLAKFVQRHRESKSGHMELGEYIAAAKDLVKFTADRDPVIGGTTQVVSIDLATLMAPAGREQSTGIGTASPTK